jgi:DMSO/TMAO reductase YedYZ molybdopterin-dependent catalytic subunit
VAAISRGFTGRGHRSQPDLPPGQYLVTDFPVLSAGPTPRVDLRSWKFRIVAESGTIHSWDWAQLRALPRQDITVDLHCVTKWSKLQTRWAGVSLDTLLDQVDTAAPFALVGCYGGYTTNLPMDDLLGGQAWVAYSYDGTDLPPEHGGPARLLVPHLYLWKSAKWVNEIRLLDQETQGFWESVGYHNYGDPWLEQRYWGD